MSVKLQFGEKGFNHRFEENRRFEEFSSTETDSTEGTCCDDLAFRLYNGGKHETLSDSEKQE